MMRLIEHLKSELRLADAVAWLGLGLMVTAEMRHLGAYCFLLAIFLELRSLRPK